MMKSSSVCSTILLLGLIATCLLIEDTMAHVSAMNATKDYNCGGNQGKIVISAVQGGALDCSKVTDFLNNPALALLLGGISLSDLLGDCTTAVPISALAGAQDAQCCSKGSQCDLDQNCAANCPGSSQRGGSGGVCASAECCSYDC